MSRICVCGVDEMFEVVERLRPGRLVSLLPHEDQPPTPPQLRAEDHLRLLMDDIDAPQPGLAAPSREHVAQLVTFVRAAPPPTSIVIHCLAGVSRSPAAALVALVLDAPGRELDACRLLRAQAPFADPNRRLVQIADAVLRRDGALVAALEAIGEPDFSDGFAPFLLPRRF